MFHTNGEMNIHVRILKYHIFNSTISLKYSYSLWLWIQYNISLIFTCCSYVVVNGILNFCWNCQIVLVVYHIKKLICLKIKIIINVIRSMGVPWSKWGTKVWQMARMRHVIRFIRPGGSASWAQIPMGRMLRWQSKR